MVDPTGVVGLLGLFTTCLEGYKICLTISAADEDAKRIRLRMYLEKERFVGIGRTCGLLPHHGQHRQREALKQFLQEDTFRRKAIEDALDLIADLLHKGGNLDRRHIAPEGVPESLKDKQTLKNSLNDGYHQLRVFFKKFTWSVRDKVAYEELLQHLVGFNDTLENILPGPLQLFLETALSATVCAAGVSNASDLPEIEKVSMQHAFLTSQLKWTSSVNNLGLVSRGSKLEEKDLERLSQDHKDKYRYLVKTRQGESNECFLVDWSQWEQTLDERLERIREISGLLSGGRCNDLRFLACMGYLEDQDYKAEKSRYALVYKFVGHRRRVKSLLQLLETFRTVQLPPLETRLTIARSLCRAVMLYHSSNWIHHDFRSHNIIFAGRTAITDDTFKFNGVEYQGLEVEEPYIVGFSHARNEADVSLMFKNRELTSKTLKEQSLYWSPDYLSSRGDKRTKQSFQRTHDIYALGCVLLELGVWKPLDSYWKSTYDNDHEKWYRRLLAEEGKLRAMCGSRYAETIIHCLNWGTSDIETDVQSLAFDILLRLEEIVV